MLTRKLLSLLISVLLTLSPFAALDVAAATVGKGHCMMMDSNGDNAAIGVHRADTAAGHTMPDCKYCQDDGCSDNNCADHGCSTSHSLSLLNTSVMPVQYHGATPHLTRVGAGLLSHSAPPLLRPPV